MAPTLLFWVMYQHARQHVMQNCSWCQMPWWAGLCTFLTKAVVRLQGQPKRSRLIFQQTWASFLVTRAPGSYSLAPHASGGHTQEAQVILNQNLVCYFFSRVIHSGNLFFSFADLPYPYQSESWPSFSAARLDWGPILLFAIRLPVKVFCLISAWPGLVGWPRGSRWAWLPGVSLLEL